MASTVVAIVGYQLIELHIIITPKNSASKEIYYVGAFAKSDSRKEMGIFRGEGVVGENLTTNHIGW